MEIPAIFNALAGKLAASDSDDTEISRDIIDFSELLVEPEIAMATVEQPTLETVQPQGDVSIIEASLVAIQMTPALTDPDAPAATEPEIALKQGEPIQVLPGLPQPPKATSNAIRIDAPPVNARETLPDVEGQKALKPAVPEIQHLALSRATSTPETMSPANAVEVSRLSVPRVTSQNPDKVTAKPQIDHKIEFIDAPLDKHIQVKQVANVPEPAATPIKTQPAITVTQPIQSMIESSLGPFSLQAANPPIIEFRAGGIPITDGGLSDIRQNPAPITTSAANISAQIFKQISGASEQRIEVRLDPPELGRVVVNMTSVDNQIHAVITAERADIVDLMRRHADLLASALEDAGFGQATLDFQSGENAEDTTNTDESHPHPYGSTDQDEVIETTSVSVSSDRLDIRL